MVAGLVFAVIAVVVGSMGWFWEGSPIGKVPATVLAVGSLLLSIVSLVIRLYVKTSANKAFVRTGMSGAKPILDGGAMVVPIVHNVIPISLETMKLDVERYAEHALITKDNLRVDVRGEFYIKVDANREDILAAARSLGERGTHPQQVSDLVFEKLVSALRSVAATMDLVEIHSRREEFAKAVFESVREDLKHNGLTLESVTVSRLDQTDPKSLSDANIFDAQGKKKITEITQAALTERTRLERTAEVERNRLDRNAERERQTQDVETRKEILALNQEQAQAEADQTTYVANYNAGKEREQAEFKIQQEQQVQEATIARTKALEQARIEQELTVQRAGIQRDQTLIQTEQEKEQADIARKQAVETARIAQLQAVEVARREQEIIVAKKEAERAAAEREAFESQAGREKASQEVLTVTATSEADREAQTKLIAAKQVIEQDKIKRQTDAEVDAFAQVKDAEGEQQAAEQHAQARLRLAEAEAKAKRLAAEAEQAQRMVEIEIEKQRVELERQRVEIERQALENKQTFDKAAIGFETAKLQIEAVKEAQVAMARSIGEFMSKGNFTIFGDPLTLAEMSKQFHKGLGIGQLAEGLIDGAPDSVKGLVGALGEQLKPVVEKMTKTNGNAAPAQDESPSVVDADPVDDEDEDAKA